MAAEIGGSLLRPLARSRSPAKACPPLFAIAQPDAARLRVLTRPDGVPKEPSLAQMIPLDLDAKMATSGCSLCFVEAKVWIAREAYRDFGRGSGHPARLNFGDCFAYALARATGEPLLFTGGDFARTDITAALSEQLEG